MKNVEPVRKTGMDTVGGCLIVPVASGISSGALERLGREITERVGTARPRGVIVNVSPVTIMDSHDFSILQRIGRAISMMGSTTVIVGIRPGVASSLVDLDTEFGEMLFASTTEDAFELLRNKAGRSADGNRNGTSGL